MEHKWNPYVGRPGFWNKVNRTLFPFIGPAQIGVGYGRTEEPYVPPVDPVCPICTRPMADHAIERGNATTRTYLTCPK
ncbi:hypothetical protein [Planctomonas psychrotolerans]|uniref:hypothetical protein n=1 Tax=Planctomonas psychrotolerans TaxID=2528712 RepID=UPI001D0CE9E5|nr:hypothetical protein [Planctomonas psychrotolerans]